MYTLTHVMLFSRLLIFSNLTFWINSYRKTIRVSNNLAPDQAQHFVRPDLNPNWLQRGYQQTTLAGEELRVERF